MRIAPNSNMNALVVTAAALSGLAIVGSIIKSNEPIDPLAVQKENYKALMKLDLPPDIAIKLAEWLEIGHSILEQDKDQNISYKQDQSLAERLMYEPTQEQMAEAELHKTYLNSVLFNVPNDLRAGREVEVSHVYSAVAAVTSSLNAFINQAEMPWFMLEALAIVSLSQDGAPRPSKSDIEAQSKMLELDMKIEIAELNAGLNFYGEILAALKLNNPIDRENHLRELVDKEPISFLERFSPQAQN